MKILQLGNGGGFDFDQVSSSFLIKLEKDRYLLFDCGHGIMRRLQELEKEDNATSIIDKINTVFISHMHDDHIGELSSLILYRYFIYGLQTTVICTNALLEDQLEEYLSYTCKTEFNGCQVRNKKMYFVYPYYSEEKEYSDYEFVPLETYHPGVHSGGLLILDKTDKLGIAITGDTKANANIEETIQKISSKNSDFNFFIFHDWSLHNEVSRNVHACNDDIEIEYSFYFRKTLIPYHTGESIKDNPISKSFLGINELSKLYLPYTSCAT